MNKKISILILILFTIFISADFVFAKQGCNVSNKIDTGYPDMEQGKIPIGEAVDESELLVQNLMIEMQNIINEIPSMRSSVENLLPRPPLCTCVASGNSDLISPNPCNECSCSHIDGEYNCTNCPETCNCNCTTEDMYDYKENCSCSDCDTFNCTYDPILGECDCTNNCDCGHCADEQYVCQDSGCECECEYDEASEKCECENCTPKNPEFECECELPTDHFSNSGYFRPRCRNYPIYKKCCGLLGCHCNSCRCSTCNYGIVCPNTEIAKWIDTTIDPYSTENPNFYSIGNINLRITASFNKIDNLIEVKNLTKDDPSLPDDPNRWKILNKLIDSRKKLEKCITGYSFVKKENKQQEQLFSCDIILREKYVNETVILGFFQNKYPHCYPFTIEVQKENSKCKNGRTEECLNEIANMELMDNYFCCKGE